MIPQQCILDRQWTAFETARGDFGLVKRYSRVPTLVQVYVLKLITGVL